MLKQCLIWQRYTNSRKSKRKRRKNTEIIKLEIKGLKSQNFITVGKRSLRKQSKTKTA